MTSHEKNPTTVDQEQHDGQTAKDKAREVRDKAQAATEQATQKARETADEVAQKAKEESRQLAGTAKQEARSMAEQRKSQMASELDSIAEAFHKSSRELHTQDEAPVARYATKVADQLEHASSYLRQHSVDDILGDAENFARQQPELFLAGAFGLGVVISRFFKSSESDRYGNGSRGDRYGRDFRSDEYTQGNMRSQQRVRSELPTTTYGRSGSATLPEGETESGDTGGTS